MRDGSARSTRGCSTNVCHDIRLCQRWQELRPGSSQAAGYFNDETVGFFSKTSDNHLEECGIRQAGVNGRPRKSHCIPSETAWSRSRRSLAGFMDSHGRLLAAHRLHARFGLDEGGIGEHSTECGTTIGRVRILQPRSRRTPITSIGMNEGRRAGPAIPAAASRAL